MAANTRAYNNSGSVSAPGQDIVAVTKSDSTADPNGPFRGLCFDAAGAIKLVTLAGNTVTIPSGVLAAGVIHPIQFTQIWTTGTTATNLYGVL